MSKPFLTLPCKYTADDFELRQEGHHCTSCSHTLKDFRTSSDKEIEEHLRTATGNTCGIFRSEQVQPKTTIFGLGLQRRVGLSLLGILGYLGPAVLTSCDAKEQPIYFPKEKSEADKEREAFERLHFPMTVSGSLRRRFNDGEPLGMATVRIVQGGKTVRTAQSDTEGRFSLTLERGDLDSSAFELLVEHPGFEPETMKEVGNLPEYQRKHLSISLKTYPEPSPYMMLSTLGTISGMLSAGDYRSPYEAVYYPQPVSLQPLINDLKAKEE